MKAATHSRLARGAGCAVLLLLSLALAPAAGAVDLSGTWSGSWQSDRCRHHGPMSATFTKIDETHYCVNFRGRFFKIMPFRYSAVLTVTEEGEVTKLAGSSYLGRIMGTFSYSATATATDFNANYSSCKDWGRFCLHKCGCSCCQ
jgi:hypothetical protein